MILNLFSVEFPTLDVGEFVSEVFGLVFGNWIVFISVVTIFRVLIIWFCYLFIAFFLPYYMNLEIIWVVLFPLRSFSMKLILDTRTILSPLSLHFFN